MDCRSLIRHWWTIPVLGIVMGIAVPSDAAEVSESSKQKINSFFEEAFNAEDLPAQASVSEIETLRRPVVTISDFDSIDPEAPVRIPASLLVDEKQDDVRQQNDSGTKIDPPKRVKPLARHGETRLVQYESPKKPIRLASTASATESNEFTAIQTQIADLLAANAKRGISMVSNTPCDLMVAALPYGADAMVFQPSNEPAKRGEAVKGGYIYTIGSLCWNYSCGGKTLLRADGKKVYARTGFGYQNKPSQFLALLAMSNIKEVYEIRVDGGAYTISNLIAAEKEAIRSGSNLSLTLVGLSFYVQPGDRWKNDRGETWSLEKMINSELNRSIDQGTSDVTDWLLGLSSAVQVFASEEGRIPSSVELARKQIGTYHEFILSIQNEQGLWHPNFFLYKGVSDNLYETLYASGHVLRFLAHSLPESELRSPKVVKAIQSLMIKLGQVPQSANAVTLTDKQLESLALALQAISIYNQRLTP